MTTESLRTRYPYTIEAIISQCRGRSINGAFAYVGAHNFHFSHPEGNRDRECRPSAASTICADGCPMAEMALSFAPSTNKKLTRMLISYEPDDTYTFYFYEQDRKTHKCRMLVQLSGAYGEDLQGLIEQAYDRYINERQNSFIHLD